MARIPPDIVPLLPQSQDSSERLGTMIASIAQGLVNALLSVGVALVLTVYLLVDGRRTWEWLVAFVPVDRRARVDIAALEARKTIVGYMRGNVLTSAIAAGCAYVFLLIFHVPAPLLLAVLTGIFDFIPVLGIFLTAIPMVLLAFTVSVPVGLATIAFNVAYNAIENYYISPKVYGNELRLSSLAVILAFAVGAALGGVLGALIVLPIAALYPAIETLWLGERLGPHVVKEHRAIERSEEH